MIPWLDLRRVRPILVYPVRIRFLTSARSGDLLTTGPTNTNLLDVYLVLRPGSHVPHR